MRQHQFGRIALIVPVADVRPVAHRFRRDRFRRDRRGVSVKACSNTLDMFDLNESDPVNDVDTLQVILDAESADERAALANQ